MATAGKVREAIDASDYAESPLLPTDIMDQVLMEGERAVGIKPETRSFMRRWSSCRSEQLIDGASRPSNRLCARRSYAHGHQRNYPLDQQRLEDRFQLRGRSG